MTNTTTAYICDGVRTPIGRYGGALSGVRTDDLAAIPLRVLMARHAFEVEDRFLYELNEIEREGPRRDFRHEP